MNNSFKLKLAAYIAGIGGFIGWLANTPPEQQDALLGPLVALMPVHWRPAIGTVMRIMSTVATIYAAYKAFHPVTTPQPIEDSRDMRLLYLDDPSRTTTGEEGFQQWMREHRYTSAKYAPASVTSGPYTPEGSVTDFALGFRNSTKNP